LTDEFRIDSKPLFAEGSVDSKADDGPTVGVFRSLSCSDGVAGRRATIGACLMQFFLADADGRAVARPAGRIWQLECELSAISTRR
jgi:hypothetical protein